MNSIWIARDKDGGLYAYQNRPLKNIEERIWGCLIASRLSRFAYRLNSDWFPELTWQDEPVELVIKERKVRKLCLNCVYFKDEAMDGSGLCDLFDKDCNVMDSDCEAWIEKENKQ